MKFSVGNFSLPAIPMLRDAQRTNHNAVTSGSAAVGSPTSGSAGDCSVGVDILDPYLISLAVGKQTRERLFHPDESAQNRFLRIASMQLLTGERCQMLLLLCRVG
eukprot:GHVS01086621.1.p2 GENE.GHVS01086621.1~~GHVS01086621.1.p2  ORF type:complete len:105 (-),score=21.00 GHVS01086621.1:45-359(-)